MAVIGSAIVPVSYGVENQIAMFSSLPPVELIESLTTSYHYNILTANQPVAPKPQILTFDNTTHIMVWKFTKEQREYLKTHESFVGIEENNIVHIAPFNRNVSTTNVEEQGSDAPSLDGSQNGQSFNALLNGTRIITQRDVPNWGLARISQKYLPLQTDYSYPESAGDGVDVYVIDTGINVQHTDFGGRARWGITTVENSGDQDDNGHGTFVAGIIGGSTYGVAKKVRMIAVKALDENGSGTVSDILLGLQFVIKNAKKLGNSNRSIVNLSLGTQKSTALDQAVTALANAGIIMVAAAGNGDENGVGQDACDFSPASARTALTVGSTDRSDNIAGFSNYGPCVNLFAPGVKIRSTWVGSNTATYVSSGTSFSTPFAAGAMATYISERTRQNKTVMQSADIIRAITGMATSGVIQGLQPGSPNLLLYNRISDTLTTQRSAAAFDSISYWMISCLIISPIIALML
ncbi:peptidase S8/S53 domain-containing protein [Umbelopsis sp. PMI_123]|nr:peptidase S8/S53 domain-containing protein [Umbelopsis sp. PMI_123]